MINSVLELFDLVGANLVIPATMAEFIPWFIGILFAMGLIVFIFGCFKYWIGCIFGSGRRW